MAGTFLNVPAKKLGIWALDSAIAGAVCAAAFYFFPKNPASIEGAGLKGLAMAIAFFVLGCGFLWYWHREKR